MARSRASINKHIPKPKLTLTLVTLVLLAVVGIFVYARYFSPDHDKNSSDTAVTGGVDLSPATPAEQQDSNEHKEQSIKTPTTVPPNGGKTEVTPQIVDASQYDQTVEVRSFIPSLIENGGTCTIVFTQGSTNITKSVAAQADATSTQCAKLSVDRSEFNQTGIWSVVVSYVSSTATGKSAQASLEIK